MKSIISWMADNSVAANLLMLLIILGGTVSLFTLKMEVFPEIERNTVTVQVVYRGATPDEIENSVVYIIEEAVKGLDGVEKINSTASEGVGIVTITAEYGEDPDDLKERVKAEIDRLTTLPANADKPTVKRDALNNPVIQVGICGEIDQNSLTKLTERIKDGLTDYEEISKVGMSGLKNYEIAIEISETKLQQYNLTFDMVSNAIRMGSLNLPGGKIKNDEGEILIRTEGLGKNGADYENIIIRTDPNGNTLRLKDVAIVKDAFEEADMYTKFNELPAALLTVYRTGDYDAIEVAQRVHDYIEEMQPQLPEQVKLVPWLDQSLILKQRINLLVRNAIMGLILVLISLAIFLDLRLALWVAVGIVISFFGSFFIMDVMDVSINMISLFAFIVVLGIVVDDAIVVGENIFTHREKGIAPLEAAKQGANKVAIPVVFAVCTTVAAFSVLLGIEGNMGKVAYVIPVIVIAVLLFSLIESLLILPAHLGHLKAKSNYFIFAIFHKINTFADGLLDKFIEKIYTPFLKLCLSYRYVFMAFAVVTLVMTGTLVKEGIIKFTFMPNIEGDNVVVQLRMPKGSSIETTLDVIKRVENAAIEAEKEMFKRKPALKKEGVIVHLFSVIGEFPSAKAGPGAQITRFFDPSIGEINVEVLSSELRTFRPKEFLDLWREKCGTIAGINSLSFKNSIFSAGNAIQYQIPAKVQNIDGIVNDIETHLKTYEGVSDIYNNLEKGKMEFKLTLKESASRWGITLADLARQVRQGFYGEELLRVQRGTDEVKVMLRYPEEERRSFSDIRDMRIRTRSGAAIPFSEVAEVEIGRGFSQIRRLDQEPIITITADIDDTKANAKEVNASIMKFFDKEMKDKYPAFSYSKGGAADEEERTMKSMATGGIIAIFVIYLLLAIPFRSYIQPFIIMAAIPFGIIGAVLGHVIMGFDISMLSVVGIIALTGVVVNDSLVFIDNVNKYVEARMGLLDAVIKSGKDRFRPIFLTSLTTFLGLMPMIFEKSFQAKFLIPMAISLAFGVIFATIITLLLIPSTLIVLQDIKKLLFGNQESMTKEDVLHG